MIQPKYDNQGLVPAIVQDATTRQVLMLGYMNEASIEQTKASGLVTFWSRSRDTLWTKGETSGNVLVFVSMALDCDNDTILVQAQPQGPTCHRGTDTCWGSINAPETYGFLGRLETIIDDRYRNRLAGSYTSSLFDKGINKVAQKVGEEAVELVIEAKDDNDELFLGEAADLLYHFLILLRNRGMTLTNVVEILSKRHK